MQDLSTYQADSVSTDQGTTQPAPAQHRTKTMMRSKSESYKGESTLAGAETLLVQLNKVNSMT